MYWKPDIYSRIGWLFSEDECQNGLLQVATLKIGTFICLLYIKIVGGLSVGVLAFFFFTLKLDSLKENTRIKPALRKESMWKKF